MRTKLFFDVKKQMHFSRAIAADRRAYMHDHEHMPNSQSRAQEELRNSSGIAQEELRKSVPDMDWCLARGGV